MLPRQPIGREINSGISNPDNQKAAGMKKKPGKTRVVQKTKGVG